MELNPLCLIAEFVVMHVCTKTDSVSVCMYYIIKATISRCLRVTECGLEQWDVFEQ